MNTHRRGVFAAMSVLGVATALFAATLARALTIEPAEQPEPQPAAQPVELGEAVISAEPGVPSEATLSAGDIALAVDNDPFLPDRSRPEPYRLPGEDALEMLEAPAAPPVPQFQVTGTVVADGGGLAVLQVDDSPPQVLGVGESLLGWRLDAVGASTATMVSNTGRTLYLSLASGPPQRSQANEGSTRNANARIQLSPQIIRTLQQRYGEAIGGLLERAASGGADQRTAQAILQQLIQQSSQGGRGRGFITFGDNFGTAIRIRRDTTDLPLRTPENR